MSANPGKTQGVALAILVVSGLAGVSVPPSLPLPGISEAESRLLKMVLPLLLVAFGAALVGLVSALSEGHQLARFFSMLSLILINVAGGLSGQFGREGLGLVGTLVMTLPFALVVAAQETRHRRSQKMKRSSDRGGSRT